SDRLMHRLQFRYFGGHATMVTNHTVDVGGNRAGIRWYELRNSGAGWGIHQQGTYAPGANTHRWMASIAMNGDGTIALGYSASSSSIHPSIGVTGRLSGDALGTMGGDLVLFAGTGSQEDSFNRWGDYSMMSVDPVDDTTFWYTQEAYVNTASFDFKTGVFKITPPSPPGPIGSGVAAAASPVLAESDVYENYPNPFNPETWIPYQISDRVSVSIEIYDVGGSLIRTLDLGEQETGRYMEKSRAAHWDGRNQKGEIVPGGIYFYTFQAGDYQETRKMIVVK
ncbi:T9SS type A sorting domain-containing protein, partial [Candidatus Poribacteria bacterium]|nr:T9SS type A sorting domain-containing protein [Candidatus Poribacteria bacterium]